MENTADTMELTASGEELDYGGDDDSPRQSDSDSEKEEQLFKKLLRGSLAKKLEKLVAKQTELALKKINKAKIGVAHEPVAGTSAEAAARDSHIPAGATRVESRDASVEPQASLGGVSGPLRVEARAGGELIEPFDPDNKDCNVDRWLSKIDQLARIHGWSEYERAYFMQAKLKGAARSWFNRLENYDLSWAEWKRNLRQAFPRSHDYADLLAEMLGRIKIGNETMTHYYHDKMALLERCEISGEKALSCIIKGLPQDLQANARAFKCTTTGELYSGFLSSFDRYQAGADVRKRGAEGVQNRGHASGQPVPKSFRFGTDEAPGGKVRCYNCQELGTHFSRDCPKPRAERCRRCGQIGHNRFRCNRRPAELAASNIVRPKQVRLLGVCDNMYKKKATMADGSILRAYLDTGSERNILTASCIEKLKGHMIRPSGVLLRGFGGGTCTAIGEIDLDIRIDGVDLNTKALVADCDLSGAELLIGQPVLNSEHIRFTVRDGQATLSSALKDETSGEDLIRRISLEGGEIKTFSVKALQDITVGPGEECEVNVAVEHLGNGQRVWVPTKCYEVDGAIVLRANHVLSGNEDGVLRISNMGIKPVQWRKGDLMARAKLMSEAPEIRQISVSNEPLTVLNFSQIDVGEICEKDRESLMNLLTRRAQCFSRGDTDLGLTNLAEMRIQLTSDKPVYYRPYRLAQSERAKVRDKVQVLLDGGVIRESESDYSSPIILIPKKNGDVRMCVDYRALNRLTVKDRYPLPLVSDQLDKLAGKCYYTTLDLAQGYHQVPVHADSIHKTAFITPDGQYEYLRVPFGLANAPAVFQRAINKMLGGLQNDKVLAYMDDLLIPSATVPAGLSLLQTVLSLVAKSGLKLNLTKCSFLKDRLEYLGHEVSAAGIRPGMGKIQAVKNFPVPENVHNVRQFLGLASYFRKFIKDFAIIAKPLTELTKKNVPWNWGNFQIEAFDRMKHLLCERPVLALYDSRAAVEIHTDASKWGLGGLLLQQQLDQTWRPVHYFSRTTSAAEQAYHSYELETLALVETIKRFRIYLIGIYFKAVTDCSAVRATMLKKDLVPRVARWWISLQEYDMEIEYRPGAKMQHVDALSRNPVNVCLVSISENDWFLTVQLQDEKVQAIVSALKQGLAGKDVKAMYKVVNERLYRKTLLGDRLYVPAMAKFNLVRRHHDDAGHPGFDRCLGLIKETYWFPKMGRFVKKYVQACLSCAFGKGDHGRMAGHLHPIEKVAMPFDTVHIDHLGPFCRSARGNQYVLMVVDAFTKYTMAKPTRTLRSLEAIRVLREVFGDFGYPRRIISDRGLAFTSKLFAEFMAEKGVKHVQNAIATPRANGQVERQNRTILNAIESSAESEASWDEKLPEVVWGMNQTVNASSRFSPAQLMFAHKSGAVAELTAGVQEAALGDHAYTRAKENLLHRRNRASHNLTKASRAMQARFNKRRKVATDKFKVGDLVLWRQAGTCSGEKGVNRKMINKYDGPYRVAKVLGHDRYVITAVKGVRGYKNFRAVVAIDSLRQYCSVVTGDNNGDGDSVNDSVGDACDRQDLIDLLEG